MRRTVFTIAWVLTAGLLLGMSPGIATAVTVFDPTDCLGVIATGPGSYQLTADLVNCSIDRHFGPPPPITIDLNGHTWSSSFLFLAADGNRLTNGTFDASYLEINGALDHVTVQNGRSFTVEAHGLLTVTDSTFESNDIGLSAYFGSATPGGPDRSAEVQVRDCVFHDNGTGVVIGRGSGSVVESSEFENNGSGVFIWDEDFFGSNDVVVRDNQFSGNGLAIGVQALYEVYRAHIANNQVDRSDGAGISVDVYCSFLPPSRPCGGQASVIEKNHVRRNGFAAVSPGNGDGIRVRGYDLDSPVPYAAADPAWVTLAKNQADRNADLGIDAPGVTDGGGNRAKFNGDPQQCVGVDCKVPGSKALRKRAAARAGADAERLLNLLAEVRHH